MVVNRPADADVLKLQAQLAAQLGDSDQAVEFMTAARLRAGEGWHDDDNEKLESYRGSVTEH